MPDAHLGMGYVVGSVIPTLRAVMPATVGVDIGCGMAAVRTQLTREDVDARPLGALREAIERAVPVSAGGYNSAQEHRPGHGGREGSGADRAHPAADPQRQG